MKFQCSSFKHVGEITKLKMQLLMGHPVLSGGTLGMNYVVCFFLSKTDQNDFPDLFRTVNLETNYPCVSCVDYQKLSMR